MDRSLDSAEPDGHWYGELRCPRKVALDILQVEALYSLFEIIT